MFRETTLSEMYVEKNHSSNTYKKTTSKRRFDGKKNSSDLNEVIRCTCVLVTYVSEEIEMRSS